MHAPFVVATDACDAHPPTFSNCVVAYSGSEELSSTYSSALLIEASGYCDQHANTLSERQTSYKWAHKVSRAVDRQHLKFLCKVVFEDRRIQGLFHSFIWEVSFVKTTGKCVGRLLQEATLYRFPPCYTVLLLP